MTSTGYHRQPPNCWLENYYNPLAASFTDFLERHHHSAAAQAIVANEETEITLYQTYHDYVSYGVYIARKI